MERTDTAIEHYWSIWRNTRPRDLERMELRQLESERGSGLDLTMVLCAADRQDRRRVTLSFHGVTNLHFNPGSNFVYFSLLEIRAIRDRQWEEQSYEVVEGEQPKTISFTCSSFDVLLTDGA